MDPFLITRPTLLKRMAFSPIGAWMPPVTDASLPLASKEEEVLTKTELTLHRQSSDFWGCRETPPPSPPANPHSHQLPAPREALLGRSETYLESGCSSSCDWALTVGVGGLELTLPGETQGPN